MGNERGAGPEVSTWYVLSKVQVAAVGWKCIQHSSRWPLHRQAKRPQEPPKEPG